MKTLRKSAITRWVVYVLLSGVLNLTAGCCTIFNGTSQTVRVITHPEGKTVEYKGMNINDGDVFTVQKEFQTPEFNVGADGRPVMVSMDYGPDPWLIGDAALLLFFIIPGLVALGVDFGTGAWRNLEDPQHVYMRE